MGYSQDQMRVGRELMKRCIIDKDEEACRVLAEILKDLDTEKNED
jgi:hypothetical protein